MADVQVSFTLDSGDVVVGTVNVDSLVVPEMADEDNWRIAANVWYALTTNGRFTINGVTYSADDCSAWWS